MTSARVPRILEISDYRIMRESYPDTTDHWSTLSPAEFYDKGPRDNLVTMTSLPRLARALASPDYDLVVVKPGTFPPWHLQAILRSLFRRSALRGVIPYFRYFGPEMIRGRVNAPIAVWDFDESPFVYKHNLFLLDRATLYFKRELPPDHWRTFMGTIHRGVPTPRFRMLKKQRSRIGKLRPISFGLPFGRDKLSSANPVPDDQKVADIFFAGRVKESTTVRQRGLAELLALRDKGYRIDVPDNNLPLDEFLKRCARAWLTWSPEGFGYECFRTYEAAICGSVPVLNRQTLDRYEPLRDGEHCFYYDVEPGGLTRTIEQALSNRAKLSEIARATRAFVLTEHTYAALGRYVAETTLALAASGDSSGFRNARAKPGPDD